MGQYIAPLRDMQFVLHELLGVEAEFKAIPTFESLDADTINSIAEEAAKFTQNVTYPLNQSGDAEGCHHDKVSGVVTAPKGFKEAYAQYVEAGWPALACDPEYGGQGLPECINNVLYEMLNSANQAWTMYPGLTHGAYAALLQHGTPELKKAYLPKIVSGHWTGTMCLTESHCGTDLGLLRTKASRWAMAATHSPARRFSSPPVSTTSPKTSSTSCSRACRMPPLAPRASACSLCPSTSRTRMAASASATASSAVPSSTRWASTATPPA